MKIYDAVKTEEKAKEILINWINEEQGKFLNFNSYIDDCTVNCECGETSGLKAWFDAESSPIAKIAICNACGDDNAFIDEVLNVY